MTDQVARALDEEAFNEETVVVQQFAQDPLLFGKWTFKKVKISDDSLGSQIDITPRWYPHTAGRYQKKTISKIESTNCRKTC